MLCPECRHFNPDNNRFCGNCGNELQQQPVSHYPREGFDEDIPQPEIADINPRIPANEYAPPRASEPDIPVRSAEPEPVVREREEAHPRSSTSIFDLEPRESEKPKYDTNPHSVKPVTYGTNMFEYDPVAAERSQTGIHGPSFLGLGDPDFMDEIEEPPSHTRRNWLVFALLVVIAIAAVEWRNIRSTGMQYAGTLHLSLPNKKGEGPAKVEPDQTAPTASGETSAAGEGKPEIVVGQTNNSAQPAGTQQTIFDSSKDANAAKATSDAKNDATETAAAKEPDKAPVKSKADATSGAADNADETAAAAKPSRKTRAAVKPPSKFVDDSGGTAGDDDLAKAEKATDPATAANWLWAATKKGNTEAPVRLADYYANGRGVPKDCEQATVLLRSSARRGNPRARARLGMYYATGQCVGQDRAQAWHWLSLAHQADPGSDWIEQYRQRLWTQMTPDERSRSNASNTASE